MAFCITTSHVSFLGYNYKTSSFVQFVDGAYMYVWLVARDYCPLFIHSSKLMLSWLALPVYYIYLLLGKPQDERHRARAILCNYAAQVWSRS